MATMNTTVFLSLHHVVGGKVFLSEFYDIKLRTFPRCPLESVRFDARCNVLTALGCSTFLKAIMTNLSKWNLKDGESTWKSS